MAANWHPAVAAQRQREDLLRSDQVATRLQCTDRWVRQLCQDKVLIGVKIGKRKWVIPESAVKDYLKSLNQED